MKSCLFCKGDIEIHKVDHMHKWGNEFYLVENIQAEVCKQCGEIFFLPETLKTIDKYVKEKKVNQRTIRVPVIELSDLPAM